MTKDADLKFFIEGSQGHRGNVLAHVLNQKLGKLLSALNQFDRKEAGARQRRVDYEITDVRKFNPTQLDLHPVARAPGCDVAAMMGWTIDELEAVQSGSEVDARVDAVLANTLVELSERPRELAFERMWLEYNGHTIRLDDTFLDNSKRLAARLIARERPLRWKQGASVGSVVGYLSQIGDLDGETKLVIRPRVGPDQVECVVAEDDRENVKSHLWTTVRVQGLLHYAESSPFPQSVVMKNIEGVACRRRSLRDMRGAFKGRPRAVFDLNGI